MTLGSLVSDLGLDLIQHDHISKIANFEHRKIASVRSFLNQDAVIQFLTSLLSRLDPFNFPLAGLPSHEISHLKHIHDNAAV